MDFESLARKAMWPGGWEEKQDLSSEVKTNKRHRSSFFNDLFDVGSQPIRSVSSFLK